MMDNIIYIKKDELKGTSLRCYRCFLRDTTITPVTLTCVLTLQLFHLNQKLWMISVRWNVTYIWSHSSVTRVRLHGKNRAKTNRAESSPANAEHEAKVYCSCSTLSSSLSFHLFPICASLVSTLLCFDSFLLLSLLLSLSTALQASIGETERQSAHKGSTPTLDTNCCLCSWLRSPEHK